MAFCKFVNGDGTPFDGCPRTTLEKALNELMKYGYTLKIGMELEFQVYKVNPDGNLEVLEYNLYNNANSLDLIADDLE